MDYKKRESQIKSMVFPAAPLSSEFRMYQLRQKFQSSSFCFSEFSLLMTILQERFGKKRTTSDKAKTKTENKAWVLVLGRFLLCLCFLLSQGCSDGRADFCWPRQHQLLEQVHRPGVADKALYLRGARAFGNEPGQRGSPLIPAAPRTVRTVRDLNLHLSCAG